MNRIFVWFLPLLACAMLYSVFTVLRHRATVTPESLVTEAELEMKKRKGRSLDVVLEKFDRALQMTRDAGDREKEIEVITRRVEVYRTLQRWDRARADLRVLLDEYTPDDPTIIVQLAQLEGNQGARAVALDRLDRLLEERPGHGGARRLRADFTVKYGDEVLLRCHQICQSAMDDAQAAQARALTRTLTVLAPEDPRRVGLLQKVNGLFPPGSNDERNAYNDAMTRASVIFDSAFTDYAMALSSRSDIPIIEGLIDLLVRRPMPDDAVDFARATQPRLMTSKEAGVYQDLARVLASTGRFHEAGLVVTRFSPSAKDLDLAFLPDWLEIARASGQWTSMGLAAVRLRKAATGWKDFEAVRSKTLFYQGYAQYRSGQFASAVTALRLFTEAEVVIEPFPGALAMAEAARADCASRLNGEHWRQEEATTLQRSLLLREDAAADEWLRLYELQRRHGFGAVARETTLSHLIASLPDRVSEFEGPWRATGREVLDRSRLDITQVREQLNQRGRLVPTEDIGAFAFYLLADYYTREREWLGAYAACLEVFEKVPFHSLTVDLFLQICDQLGRTHEAIELLIDRQRFLGGHAGTRELLERYRPWMTVSQVQELMQVDPTGFGRRESIEWLIEHERYAEGLAALESIGFRELSDFEKTCMGECLLGLGRSTDALAALGRIPADAPSYPRAFNALLRAAIDSPDPRVLEIALAGLEAPESPTGPLLDGVVDSLLQAGKLDAALRVADFLDSAATTRSSTNLMRLAVIHLLAGREAEVRDVLERAHAFRDDGGALIGHLIADVVFERWNHVPKAAADLGAERADLSVIGTMTLSLLGGREETVANLLGGEARPEKVANGVSVLLRGAVDALTGDGTALEGLPADVRAATARFLEGTPDAPRDPRRALALVLALDDPDWALWAVQALRGERERGLTLWPDLLEAEALIRLGRFRAADPLIARLIRQWPKFLPSWALGTRLSLEAPADDAVLGEFAANGWTSAPSPDSIAARQVLPEVRRLRAEGEPGKALQEAREGLSIFPKDPPLLYQVGLCYQEQGRYEDALIAMRAFLHELPARARDAALPDVLALAGRGLDEGKLNVQQWNSIIEQIAEVFGGSSLVTLHDARREVRVGMGTNPVAGVNRAIAKLDRFRAQHRGESVEDHGAGALEAWHDLYTEIAPDRGELFLRSELALDPRSIDVRVLLAENLLGQNRFEDALNELALLLDMIPEKRALAQLARLRARSGAAPEVVSQLCLRLRTLGDSRPEDPEIAFLEALGKTNGTRADALEAAEVLEALWARRDELDLALAADVGRAAGVVLFRVGDAPMAQRAQRIFTALSELDLPGAERRLYATMSRIGPNPSGADLGRPPVARPAPPPERAVLPGMPVVKPGTRPPRPAPNGPAVKAPAAAVEVMKEMTKEERQELRAQQATLTPQQRKALRKLLVGKSADEVAALQQKLADMPMKEREQFLQRVVTDR